MQRLRWLRCLTHSVQGARLKTVHQDAPVERLASRLEAEHRLCQHRFPLQVASALRCALGAHPRPMLLRPGKALKRRLRKGDHGSPQEAVSRYPQCMTPRIGHGSAVGDLEAAQKPCRPRQARLTRMMGIAAVSFAGMKKNASTITRAAMTICTARWLETHGGSFMLYNGYHRP